MVEGNIYRLSEREPSLELLETALGKVVEVLKNRGIDMPLEEIAKIKPLITSDHAHFDKTNAVDIIRLLEVWSEKLADYLDANETTREAVCEFSASNVWFAPLVRAALDMSALDARNTNSARSEGE